jgi:hypothetical protein
MPTTCHPQHEVAMIDQTRGRLVEVTRRLLVIVDQAPDVVVRPRRPSRREQDSTDRRDGRFAPTTPGGTGKPSGRSDPTLRAILARERDIQQHTTSLWQIVNGTDDLMTPPKEPPTRLTLTGRHIIDDSILRCRTHIVVATDHLGLVLDHLGELQRKTDDEDAALHWTDRTQLIDRDLRRLAARIGPIPLRMCRAGCGAPAPPKGRGATCARCRQTRSRLTRNRSL